MPRPRSSYPTSPFAGSWRNRKRQPTLCGGFSSPQLVVATLIRSEVVRCASKGEYDGSEGYSKPETCEVSRSGGEEGLWSGAGSDGEGSSEFVILSENGRNLEFAEVQLNPSSRDVPILGQISEAARPGDPASHSRWNIWPWTTHSDHTAISYVEALCLGRADLGDQMEEHPKISAW